MALDKTDNVEVFSVDFLSQTTLEELQGLGWIEEVTNEVRTLVNQSVKVFLAERDLERAKTPMEKLERSCNARRRRLNNLIELNRKNLEAVGIEKPEAESLPNALYPLVYLKMLENLGFDVLQVVRDSFLELKTCSVKKNKAALVRIIKDRFMTNEMFASAPQNLLESLEGLLGSYNGRTRLGEMLFNEDPENLNTWVNLFPDKPKSKIKTIPGESETIKEALIEDFLKVKYFAGNPHTAPGVFIQFKKMLENYVGPHEESRLSVQKSSKAFLVGLGGQTKVNRVGLSTFLEAVQTAWTEKFGNEEPLLIETNLQTDGDAARGGMAI